MSVRADILNAQRRWSSTPGTHRVWCVFNLKTGELVRIVNWRTAYMNYAPDDSYVALSARGGKFQQRWFSTGLVAKAAECAATLDQLEARAAC